MERDVPLILKHANNNNSYNFLYQTPKEVLFFPCKIEHTKPEKCNIYTFIYTHIYDYKANTI